MSSFPYDDNKNGRLFHFLNKKRAYTKKKVMKKNRQINGSKPK